MSDKEDKSFYIPVTKETFENGFTLDDSVPLVYGDGKKIERLKTLTNDRNKKSPRSR